MQFEVYIIYYIKGIVIHIIHVHFGHVSFAYEFSTWYGKVLSL